MEYNNELEHRERLDVEMMRRGLTRSRSSANDLILRKKVSVNKKIVTKPSTKIISSDQIFINSLENFVSRAGEKLNHALKTFKINVFDLEVVDIGSSTGGFTDCLLKNGAKKIIAIDVGTDQMVSELKKDPRVEIFEGTNVRTFKLPHHVDMVAIDVSFISLALILPRAYEFLKPEGFVIALVKPQFEVGMEIAKKFKGVITDEKQQKLVLENIKSVSEKIGFQIIDETLSPITGEKGNREFLLFLQKTEIKKR